MSDSPPNSQEIEITPEMLRAGRDYLSLSLGEGVPLEDYAEAVAVMLSANQTGDNLLSHDVFHSLYKGK